MCLNFSLIRLCTFLGLVSFSFRLNCSGSEVKTFTLYLSGDVACVAIVLSFFQFLYQIWNDCVNASRAQHENEIFRLCDLGDKSRDL